MEVLSVEPAALGLETSTAFWLCNVQSQPWPVALGCPSWVMGPAMSSDGHGEGTVGGGGTQKSNNNPGAWPLASGRQSTSSKSRGLGNTDYSPCWDSVASRRLQGEPGGSGAALAPFPPSSRAWTPARSEALPWAGCPTSPQWSASPWGAGRCLLAISFGAHAHSQDAGLMLSITGPAPVHGARVLGVGKESHSFFF